MMTNNIFNALTDKFSFYYEQGELMNSIDLEEKLRDLNNAEPRKCSCLSRPNRATRYLNIVSQVEPEYYCNQCSVDLLWHGIAEDITVIESQPARWRLPRSVLISLEQADYAQTIDYQHINLN